MAGEHAVEPLAGLVGGDADTDVASRVLRHGQYVRIKTPTTRSDPHRPAPIVARVRLLMSFPALTTRSPSRPSSALSAIAFSRRRKRHRAMANGTITLPKGARVVSTRSAMAYRVTLDIGGATEIRTFDLKTLQPTGRLRFGTEP